MNLCLSCAASGRRRDCDSCARLAPIPNHQRVADSIKNLAKDYRANDPVLREIEEKDKAYRIRQEALAVERDRRRMLWKRHDRRTHGGVVCDIKDCVCGGLLK